MMEVRLRRLSIALLMMGLVAVLPAQDEPLTVFVKGFTMRPEDSELARFSSLLTDEFETAVIATDTVDVVERAKINQLLKARQIEQAAREILDETRSVLVSEQANAVIFGELFDDIAGGEVVITARLTRLSGAKIGQAQVRLGRGKIHDSEDRVAAMKQLADTLLGSSKEASPRALLVGRWRVSTTGTLPASLKEKLEETKKESGNEMEAAIGRLGGAVTGMAEVASGSGSMLLDLAEDSTYALSERTGLFANHPPGNSGTWTYNPGDRRLMLIPVGGRASFALVLETITRDRLTSTGSAGERYELARVAQPD